MSSNAVTHTRKDRDGDVLAIGVKNSWIKSKVDAIRDIPLGTNDYYVAWPDQRTTIRVVPAVPGRTAEYLRTDRDATTKNNLDDLPDF